MSKVTKKRILKIVLFLSIMFIFMLILVEGILACTKYFYPTLFSRSDRTHIVAEKLHTEFDKDLGWINLPHFYNKDMYGQNKYLKINSQRFRSDYPISLKIPIKKLRIISCGDSFTLGYGVANNETWCHHLGEMNSIWEVVNMGQGGYGVDQAYLWYLRDGVKLEHNICLFNFITWDIYRAAKDSLAGYSKPKMKIDNGKLVVRKAKENKPYLLENLHTYRLFQSISKKLPKQKNKTHPKRDEMKSLFIAILKRLQQTNEESNRTLVIIHLPVKGDHEKLRESEFWRKYLKEHAKKENWIYLDLIGPFQSLSHKEMLTLFIPKTIKNYLYSAGHYNEKGNRHFAEKIYKKLLTIPKVKKLLK